MTTQELIDRINAKKKVKWPDVGYSFYVAFGGECGRKDGVYTISNKRGKVTWLYSMNGYTSAQRRRNLKDTLARLR